MQGFEAVNRARVEWRTRVVEARPNLREPWRVIRDGRKASSDDGKAGSVGHRTHDGKQDRGGTKEMPVCPWNPTDASLHRKRSKMKIAPNNCLITKGHKKCSQ